jgi:polar amino acid transport system substrate-binding protein
LAKVRVVLANTEASHNLRRRREEISMNRRRGVVAVCLAVVALAVLTTEAVAKCEPEKAAQKYPSVAGKKIKIAVDPQTPPYTVRDAKDFNNIIGFDADLARAAFKCVGLQLEFVAGSWSALLPSVIAGQNDVMWSNLYYTTERAKQASYVPYMQAGTGALVRKGNPKKIKSMDDTCGVRAAAGLGTVEEAAFREQSKKCAAAGKGEIQQISYPDIAGGTRLIQNDRADIMLTDLALVDQLARDNPDQFERGFSMLTGFKVGAAVKKGNEDLLKAIFDGIQELQADGTERELLKKYGLDPMLQIPAAILRE